MRFSFNNITLDFTSSRQDFTGYLERLYGGLKTEAAAQEADITTTVTWSPSLADSKRGILDQKGFAWKKVGAQTYIAEKACLYNEKIDRRNTLIFLAERDKKLSFRICRQEKPLSDFFRKDIEDQLREWTHYFVFFPLFFYAEHVRGLHPLHAGLAVFRGKNVVIMGLENAGKTSLTIEMARRKNSLLLSDNLCLYGPDRVHSCHQPIKMRRDGDIVGPDRLKLAHGTRQKEYFFPDAAAAEGYTPDLVLLPCFAQESFVRELNATEAARFILNANPLVSEIKQYIACSWFWSFGLDAEPSTTAQKDHLLRLLTKCRCYQVGIGPKESVAQTVDRVEKLFN